MRANTPQSLNPTEAAVWRLYSQQRLEELRVVNPTSTDSDRQNLVWFEYLQMKWSISSGTNEKTSVAAFDRALKEHNFGPDLRSSHRELLNLSKTIKIKKVKNHTIKSHLRGARDGHKPGISHNSSYTFYVHKRTAELKKNGVPFCVKSTIPEIAKEWSQLSDEKRLEIDSEWRKYCSELKNNKVVTTKNSSSKNDEVDDEKDSTTNNTTSQMGNDVINVDGETK